MMIKETTSLIIGSGISGLSYALKIAESCPKAKVTIITKSDEEESNTKYAQGGVAVVLDHQHDSLEKHINDTLRAGDGLCDEEVVKMVVEEGPVRIQEIIEWGANFDKNKQEKYDLGREGGHTENRVMHNKDKTGAEMERALLKKIHESENITLLSYHYAIDLLVDETNTCYGASVLNIKSKEIIKIYADITMLATGGCGHVYKNTTNPSIATGDGIALASRAKAKISNMQFIQFHPTAFYKRGTGQLPLISEAVRGAGAKLLTASGKPFMYKYDNREELASRDIVTLAIDKEMKAEGSQHLYLDCRAMPQDELLNHFPNIYKECEEQGIDMFKDLIPIVPASHYLCGGIEVDKDGQSSIRNLFAVGECTNTGLHGANRLASNSLLEALVYGHRAAVASIRLINEEEKVFDRPKSISHIEANTNIINEIDHQEITELKLELQTLMSKYVGIVRNNEELQLAKRAYETINLKLLNIYNTSSPDINLEELRNLLCVASLIINQSITQTENKGTYYNTDLN